MYFFHIIFNIGSIGREVIYHVIADKLRNIRQQFGCLATSHVAVNLIIVESSFHSSWLTLAVQQFTIAYQVSSWSMNNMMKFGCSATNHTDINITE